MHITALELFVVVVAIRAWAPLLTHHCSFHVRKEIKTIQCSNFQNAIFICVAESISRINILFSIIQNSLLRRLSHILYEPHSSRSACYGGLCSLNAKQHTFGTFGQISKLQGKQ